MKRYLDNYIESLMTKGRYWVTREELYSQFNVNDSAVRHGLRRLTGSKRIFPVRSGFYTLIPPEHRMSGVLPPEMFIDDFMRYLGRPYYVGLLSAAALHGAGHQQPQIFSVIINQPPVRPIQNKGLSIRFPVKSGMPQNGIRKKKTSTGFFSVSSPELTAMDLMAYLRQSGGLSAVTSVLEELTEQMVPEELEQIVRNYVPAAALQRLGFIIEEVFGRSELAVPVFNELQRRSFFHIPLNPAEPGKGSPVNKKWKISVNTDPEAGL